MYVMVQFMYIHITHTCILRVPSVPQPCHVVYTEFRPTPLQHYIYPSGADGLYLVVDEKVIKYTSISASVWSQHNLHAESQSTSVHVV